MIRMLVKNSHVSVVPAALCHPSILRQERLWLTASVQRTLVDGQTVDICPQTDRFANSHGVEDGIEPRTAWYIVYVKAANFGKLCFQELGSLRFMASYLWIEMQMPAHIARITIIVTDLRQYLLVSDSLGRYVL